MIADFLASWELFSTTYAVALLLAATLSTVGVWLVAREQVFFGMAVSQASAFGVALSLWLGTEAWSVIFGAGGVAPGLLAVAASVLTAWLVSDLGDSTTESREAITGWVFLLSASVPVLLLAHRPHGLEEVHRLMFSTLLSVTRGDLLGLAVLAAGTALLVTSLRAPLVLLAVDPEMAAAVGIRARRWSLGVAVWLGLTVGLAIRASGMLFTFGCLVLPALAAKSLCREVRPLLWVAPTLAVAGTLVGLATAHGLDLPPAHTTIGILCALLPVAWLVRARRLRWEAAPLEAEDAPS